ncbi:hypothetical protein BU14_0207s0004 [Porphyra umbilicalis]|uniref:BZIP domain-containing protein n=1 Tax=Porphyra umbilicalis TaxID=2786 RepID=A0A1X6P5R2_PORUM|nr:hypothetical protein BU14_0207s0004 [Porphyra umbilicalis]|eukprot:OSX76085.1 hypothetical protein BU14_0207s0004 [Porphyra umbilicalis]
MDTSTAILVATVPRGPAVVRVTPGGFCIVRGLGVPGGISGRSPVLSAIGLARPDVRDALKVGLVQALLDEAATPVYPPLGCAGGGLAGLGGGAGVAVGMVGAAFSAGGGGWQPRPALGCFPPGAAGGAAAAGQPFMLYPTGVGGAWLHPQGGRAGVAAAGAAAVGVVGGGIARRRGVPSRRPRADGGAAAEEPLPLDPNSAAYQRKVRNRLSAVRSNEKRRLRRLTAKAEAAAAAAAAAAGEGVATSATMAGASVAAAVAGGTAAPTSSAGLPGVRESSGTPA